MVIISDQDMHAQPYQFGAPASMMALSRGIRPCGSLNIRTVWQCSGGTAPAEFARELAVVRASRQWGAILRLYRWFLKYLRICVST